MTLAIFGGTPVRTKEWPQWPRSDSGTLRNVTQVLSSPRWAISGPFAGTESYERQFSSAYAQFHEISYCVPTANGSSALTIALEALGVTHGSEVLVPGLTWVACASSVAGVGAIPVLVDVEPDTLCMSPEAAAAAINSRTAAILLVHLFSAVARVEEFSKLCAATGIPLLEDCSQAHGASWNGRRVGTFGTVGVFSMQQTKVLTCGEGGAAVTDDARLYDLLQQLRADGRRYRNDTVAPGMMELEEIGAIQGRNYCLSEFQAAILLDRLRHLDAENAARESNAACLTSLLEQVGGITAQGCNPQADRRTYYHYCVRVDRQEFSGASIDCIAAALTAELGILVEPVDDPLNGNVLYRPLLSGRTPGDHGFRKRIDPRQYDLPVASAARHSCITFPHRILLGKGDELSDVAEAFGKVKRQAGLLGVKQGSWI